MDPHTAKHLKTEFANVQEHLDGHEASLTMLLADTRATVRLCVLLAEALGIEQVDGLPLLEWYERERRQRLHALLLGVEH